MTIAAPLPERRITRLLKQGLIPAECPQSLSEIIERRLWPMIREAVEHSSMRVAPMTYVQRVAVNAYLQGFADAMKDGHE